MQQALIFPLVGESRVLANAPEHVGIFIIFPPVRASLPSISNLTRLARAGQAGRGAGAASHPAPMLLLALGAALRSPSAPGLGRSSLVAMASPAAPPLGQESLPEMGRSVSTTLASAREQVAKAMPLIDVPRHEAAVADLERRSSMADLWDDAASAEATLRELSEHRAEVERSAKWARTLEDAEAALLLLPDLTGEPEAAVELLSDELAQLHALTAELAEWEVRQPGPGPEP